jgi:uncharacterized protein
MRNNAGRDLEDMMVSGALVAAAIWVALLMLVMVGLAIAVVPKRYASKVGLGDGGDAALIRATRAHGNAVENALPAMAGLITLGLLSGPVWLVHVLGAMVFIGRLSHAVGLYQSAGATPGRQLGMVLSWLAQIAIAVSILLIAVTR